MEITEKLKKQVEQLKSSFSVEGALLIGSNKFTKEEIQAMKKKSTCHPSHWIGAEKFWTDDQIAEQIYALMNVRTIGEKELESEVEKIMKKLPFQNKKAEKEFFDQELNKLLGLEGIPSFDPDFWREFGSAPFRVDNNDHNKKLAEARKKYGACGMTEIFGTKFDDNYHLVYKISRIKSAFNSEWDAKFKLIKLSKQVYSSPYSSLEDIKDNVVMKKAAEEGKKFYLDKTKSLEKRIEVFDELGKTNTFIFHPKDKTLHNIFEMAMEDDNYERHQTITCSSLIDGWIYQLERKRCHLDWENPYHPKLKTKMRNYRPSKAAIERLRKYYMEKLFLEEVSNFEFDW